MEGNKPTRGTIARTAVLFIVLINQIVLLLGGEALPYSESQIYEAVSVFATIAASLWTWWRNQSFTEAAIEADFFKDMLKNDRPSE